LGFNGTFRIESSETDLKDECDIPEPILRKRKTFNHGESENSEKHSARPAKPCPYCGKFKVRLTCHIKAVHKKERSSSGTGLERSHSLTKGNVHNVKALWNY